VAIQRIERQTDGSLRVALSNGDSIDCDIALFATGRRANTRGLGLTSAAIALGEDGAIKVDEDNRTSCPSVFAIGDVTDRLPLTPVAIREGHAFADSQFGGRPHRVDYEAIPSAVFTVPPIASVGLTEAEARKRNESIKVFMSDFRPMKNVLAGREDRALYKLVVHGETDVVLGVHMIGPDVPEILQAAAIAVKARLTKAQFDETVALHPTMAEELVLMT
jgi:glutathione reductase (NADPH)